MGTAVMLTGIVLMIVIHEGGHFLAAKAFGMKATEAFFGFGPRIWSITRGETEYGVKAIPLGGYVRIIGMNPLEEIDPEDEDRTYRNAPFWQKSIVVLAGIFSHFVMATLLLITVFSIWGIVATDDAGDRIPTLSLAVVAETTPSGDASPATVAGFAAEDLLRTYEGTAVVSWDEFVERVRADGGKTVLIGYDRDGVAAEASTTLAFTEVPLVVDGVAVMDESGDVVYQEVGYFGAAPEIARDHLGLLGVVGAAFRGVGEAVVQSVYGLGQLVLGFPQLVMSVFGGSDDVIGEVRPISPIGLARLAGPMESTLMMLALVNVFVGVLNFIPLYPLDGGHFAVALYEKIRGHAPDVRKLMPVAAVVVIFLITIGLMGVYLDIFKPLEL
ncbi:MAG: site-2 protease family protein [Actinomycetota bacterium]|nr:site-2 protease family protein [Actinomycetota bacterium]